MIQPGISGQSAGSSHIVEMKFARVRMTAAARAWICPKAEFKSRKQICQLLAALTMLAGSRSGAAPVPQSAAEAAAKGWLAEPHSHLAPRLQARIKSVESQSGYYVIHLKPEGFIVTSADDELEPVLAFSDRGDFKYDAGNPLCILLDRDIAARTALLQRIKSRPTNLRAGLTLAGASAQPDEAVAANAQSARNKWVQYQNRAALLTGPGAAPSRGVLSSATGDSTDDPLAGVPPAPAIHINGVSLVDDHIQLSHDASQSVTIYASYDFGRSWQVEDTGVVWPTWVAKAPVSESSCWYRIAADNIYDEMTVSAMRNPPPPAGLTSFMIPDDASAPTNNVNPVGSVSSVLDLRVAPLVQSTWNQGSEQNVNCYNYYTPNNYVDGCVATALGQLMRFWRYPTAGIGRVTQTIYVNGASRSVTTRGGDGAGGAYNWNAMPLSPSTASYNAAQWQMIGALCYDAGLSVNMDYSSGGSGAYMYACASALTTIFKYSNAKAVNSPHDLLTPTDSNLAAGCPVLFGISSSGGDGHAVVCDGFGYDSGTLYHHINMGWDGFDNAWYVLPYLETYYGFNSIDTIIYNVFPSGTGELLSGRITTSQGAPVQGAAVTATASGQNYTGTTDSKGYYGIKVPSAKTYTVTATKVGMNTATRTGVVIGTSGSSGSGNVVGANLTMDNNFSFAAAALTTNVWLRWSAPTNSGMADNTVYIRYRTDRYPTNSSDGTLVYTGTAQAYEHSGVDGSGTITNYYTIWGKSGANYATFGNNTVNASAAADPGTVRLLWTRSTGQVCAWTLRADGARKASTYVNSGTIDVSYWKVAGFNDIDRDGVSDILWTGAGGEVAYWLLNADGTQKSGGRVVPGNATLNNYWKVGGFADINGDGTADILWTGAAGEVVYWMLNPDGSRKSAGRVAANLSPTNYWTVAGFKDIDGDGTPDILWTGAGGEVVYWMLNPDGTRKSSGRVAGNLTPTNYWRAVSFEDVDGDGTPDILWTSPAGDLLCWMLKSDGTRKSSTRVYPGNATRSGYWTVSGLTDINGDGTADIIWRGQGGETKYWFLTSSGTLGSSGNISAAPVSPSDWTVRAVGRSGF